MIFSVVSVVLLSGFALFCFVRHNRQIHKRGLLAKTRGRTRKKQASAQK